MSATQTHEIRIRGTVQGVGFRPTVYKLASREKLVGEVLNDSEGVLIRISARQSQVQHFLKQLGLELPPLAKIDSIESKALPGDWHFRDFRICPSEKGAAATEVSADAATCDACRKELFGEHEHRYRYPFTNCTHCGPRISIVKHIPYDRDHTTMAPFPMCDHCRTEYSNPLDRRFHAQPVACFDCGPGLRLELSAREGARASNAACQTADPRRHSDEILTRVDRALRQGKIVAIRGIGGFHLCCDAANHDAVNTLRQRKHRYAKPFALMTHDTGLIHAYCEVSPAEQEQLTGIQAPIVLLRKKDRLPDTLPTLSEEIAPGSQLYGFMLPYTPLHWLILTQFGGPLVMTSGNLSTQPQIIENRQALEHLADIADLILYHNRDIANRIDDSVVRCMAGQPRLLRRARGYAPRSFILPDGFSNSPEILACGAELKATFCLLKNGAAIVSQHQGDLEDVNTFDDYLKNLDLYQRLYDFSPRIIASDKHPEYVSSKFARNELAAEHPEAAATEVQHHHAHIASCLAENGIPLSADPVLGIALDGLGFGDDGSLWGGEFLLADYVGFARLGRLKPIAMPGGAQAIREPWRNTYAHLVNAMPWGEFIRDYADLELCRYLQAKPLSILERMLADGINSPRASSCGRLFDAVAAAVNLCRTHARYEGQGAIELEMKAGAGLDRDGLFEPHVGAYDFAVYRTPENGKRLSLWEIDAGQIWFELLADIRREISTEIIATRFHAGLVNALDTVVGKIVGQFPVSKVALSGGCLQNKVLLENLTARIQTRGLECLSQSRFPSNDGGISLGQAAIAAAQALTAPGEKNQAPIRAQASL